MTFARSLFFFYFLSILQVVQAQDSLYYVTFPKVQEIILRHIQKETNRNFEFYGVWHSYGDTVTLFIRKIPKQQNYESAVLKYKMSKRFLLLNDERVTLPIVLEADLLHSEDYLKSKINRKTGDKVLYSTKFSYERYWGKIVYVLTGYQILYNELE